MVRRISNKKLRLTRRKVMSNRHRLRKRRTLRKISIICSSSNDINQKSCLGSSTVEEPEVKSCYKNKKFFGCGKVNIGLNRIVLGKSLKLSYITRKGGKNLISKKYKCVVAFDFDNCLMKGHWLSKYLKTNITYSNFTDDILFGDSYGFGLNKSEILKLFNFLNKQKHVLIAIASFGRRDIIYWVLNHIGNHLDKYDGWDKSTHYADNIYITTPGDFNDLQGNPIEDGCDTLRNKNPQLKKICVDVFNEITNDSLKRIIFFDDSSTNITKANELGVTVSKDDNGIPKITKPIDEQTIKDIKKHVNNYKT